MARVVLRIDFDDDRYVGHGRIQLLELIDNTGSISQAAKVMGMSYRRAWLLADSINRTFAEPVIDRRHGGKGGGSAALTDFGRELVSTYRHLEKEVPRLFAKQLNAIEKRVTPACKR
jgi:molybdate transport system regulatory protein